MKTWSKKDEATLLKVVAKAASPADALQRARAALGEHVTYDVVSNKLRRLGKPSLSESTLRNAPATPEQALEQHRERDRVADLASAKKGLLKELDTKDRQIEALTALSNAAPLKPVVAPKKVGGTQRNGVPVMLCSDWHVEEPVDPKKVDGMNEYNLDIADRCIKRMGEAFINMILDSPRYDCRAGVVWLGGDLFSGYIHEELVESNFLSPVQAVLWLQPRIEMMLRTIAAGTKLERIIVPCNDGNHGRMTHKIRVATRTANSLEYLLYKSLATRLADDKRFEFLIAEGEWSYVTAFNKTLAFTHGDSFQYGGGVGGISIPIRRGVSRQFQHRKVDYFSMGHFHQRQDYGDIAINGSMIGYGPYSERIHANPTEPRQQSWFMIDESRGKSITAPIWL